MTGFVPCAFCGDCKDYSVLSTLDQKVGICLDCAIKAVMVIRDVKAQKPGAIKPYPGNQA